MYIYPNPLGIKCIKASPIKAPAAKAINTFKRFLKILKKKI